MREKNEFLPSDFIYPDDDLSGVDTAGAAAAASIASAVVATAAPSAVVLDIAPAAAAFVLPVPMFGGMDEANAVSIEHARHRDLVVTFFRLVGLGVVSEDLMRSIRQTFVDADCRVFLSIEICVLAQKAARSGIRAVEYSSREDAIWECLGAMGFDGENEDQILGEGGSSVVTTAINEAVASLDRLFPPSRFEAPTIPAEPMIELSSEAVAEAADDEAEAAEPDDSWVGAALSGSHVFGSMANQLCAK